MKSCRFLCGNNPILPMSRQDRPHKYGRIIVAAQKTDFEYYFGCPLRLHLPPERIAIILPPELAPVRWVPDHTKNEFRRKRLHAPAGEENHA
jgi:hypothetical protein